MIATPLLPGSGRVFGALPAPLGPVGSGSHAIDVSTWGPVEWAVYASMALACIWVLWRAVRTTVHPGEEAPDHVKRSIFDDDATPFGSDSAPTIRPGTRAPDAVPPRP